MKSVLIASIFLVTGISYAKEGIPLKSQTGSSAKVSTAIELLLDCQEAMLGEKHARFSDDNMCRERFVALPNLPGRWSDIYEITNDHINVYSLNGKKFQLSEDGKMRQYQLKLGDKNMEILLSPEPISKTSDRTGFKCRKTEVNAYPDVKPTSSSDPQTIEKVRSAIEYSMSHNFISESTLWAWTLFVKENPQNQKRFEEHLREAMCKCEEAGVITPAIKRQAISLMEKPDESFNLDEDAKELLKKFSKSLFACGNKAI